ncbi:retrovirus-related pol polyprotein from transposon TNT 1-94 [Tanacetum coccineum]
MNHLDRNHHTPKTITSNIKFLDNLPSEWSRYVTLVNQTKDLHVVDYNQLYDYLKMNQDEANEVRAERLAKTHDPLAFMAKTQSPYPMLHPDQPSSSNVMQQLPSNNNYFQQTPANVNYMQQPMETFDDITDPTTTMNIALVLIAKAFKLNITPTNNNQRISSNTRNRQIAQPMMNTGNQIGYNAGQIAGNVGNQFGQNTGQNQGVQTTRNQNGLIVVPTVGNQMGNIVAARAENNRNVNNDQIRCYNYRGLGHFSRNCTVKKKSDAAYFQTQLLIAQKEEA